MTNERITEDYVRSHFKSDPLFKNIKLEEQRTSNKQIKELLKKASKKGSGKYGCPEFIITFPSIIDLILIVECKADEKNHKRNDDEKDDPEKYAVDGAVHYAKYLKDKFNVIAIAVSGQNEETMLVSNFYLKKNQEQIKEIKNNKLLTIYDYLNLFEQKEIAEKLKDHNILVFASNLNQKLYNYSIPEVERSAIVSGILIALQNKNFKKSYTVENEPIQLVEDLLTAIKRVLEKRKLGVKKIKILMGEYQRIAQSNNLAIAEKIRNKSTGIEEPNTILRDLIYELDEKIFPFTAIEHLGYDVLGQFYSEFIRYVYGDKKLGLVLTPQHITELFVDIADIGIGDVVYDNCCGTAGFLIKAMKRLMELAGNDTNKIKKIKETQLLGIEARSDMFTYACSNMMMRGDGKSNIEMGDSLASSSKKKVKKHKPTIGLLNPPYSTDVPELEFVYHNLDCLEKGGTCVAIIPINCVLAQEGIDYDWKKKLLQQHTLLAVFSMPEGLFNPSSSTVTAIVVFKAHSPHQQDHETYFGYWRDDGFIKVKHLGRVDFHDTWMNIKKNWIYNYRNKKEIKGQSLKRHVESKDEWCCEAYLKTDYKKLTEDDFERELKKYIIFKGLN